MTVTATSKKDATKVASSTVHVVAAGTVAPTANPQVALYTINVGAGANVSVNFGTDMNYGLKTWQQPATAGGGVTSLFVAGMKANTAYHLQGVVQFADGATFQDADQLFTTGALPSGVQFPTITATTTPGAVPQSGVELLDLIGTGTGASSPAAFTDLNGNIIWTYNGPAGLQLNPVKLLSNGHLLINYSAATSVDGTNSVLQEVDLTGAVIWQMTAADLNAALAAATCAGCNITVAGTHHDFLELPNGHLILISATQQTISGATVTGDVIIDLDQNHKPVWLWNEFDHLDTSRQPMGWPDWTHTNAVLYSKDDGNLIVSIRHQNWLIKVDYENGKGSGDVIWRLGYQGDFQLMGGTDPADWFYAQHGPSFVSTNTTGNFTLAVFDNGNDRGFPSAVCGTSGQPACYSTAPILEIDETAKTATLTFNPVLPYSFFGGNNAALTNGNLEYCESASGPGVAGTISEVTQSNPSQTVWRMNISGQYVYRGQRMPSLYPGVQW